MRLIFFGSPEFALPSLAALHQRHEVALVVSQPDKASGRGLSTSAPPVAREAKRLGLPLAQPARLKGNREFLEQVTALRVDVAVTVAYGKLLPQPLLDEPRHGFLNVHASLLPKYRGAAPIQWALINGESETGVSIMRTELGLDTGPICLVRPTPIEPHERAPELFARLSRLGATAITEALEGLSRDELDCREQDHERATSAPLLRREDGEIDWNRSAVAVYDRFRGVAAWPGTHFSYGDRDVRVLEMRTTEGSGMPGEVIGLTEDGLTVATGEGAIELRELQPAGRSRMRARDWANGYRVKAGVNLA